MNRHYIAIIIALLTGSAVSAQSFYVVPTEFQYEKKIYEKLRYDGVKLVDSLSKAEYKIECYATGKYNTMKLKNMFKGYVTLVDLKTGSELSRTKEIGTNAYNIKQAGNKIMDIISEKYLAALLASTNK